MKEDPDGHKVEYTVDSKGNFICKWYQKDGTLFADYDRITVVAIGGGGVVFGIFVIRPWYGYMGEKLGFSTHWS